MTHLALPQLLETMLAGISISQAKQVVLRKLLKRNACYGLLSIPLDGLVLLRRPQNQNVLAMNMFHNWKLMQTCGELLLKRILNLLSKRHLLVKDSHWKKLRH
jgi:hypothetical protein